jgi:hypothetical protein
LVVNKLQHKLVRLVPILTKCYKSFVKNQERNLKTPEIKFKCCIEHWWKLQKLCPKGRTITNNYSCNSNNGCKIDRKLQSIAKNEEKKETEDRIQMWVQRSTEICKSFVGNELMS